MIVFADVKDLILISFGVSSFAYIINRIINVLPQAISKLMKVAKG